MVPPGNPAGIATVTELGQEEIRISQPDPANEDIAFHIMDMYCQAGDDQLVQRIMEEKRNQGTTIFKVVHHRETPWRIAEKTSDVGPVWATETVQKIYRKYGFVIPTSPPKVYSGRAGKPSRGLIRYHFRLFIGLIPAYTDSP